MEDILGILGWIGILGSLGSLTTIGTIGTMTLAIIAFALLAVYLTVTARQFGLPEMVSDTYYQLGRTCG